MPRKRVKKSSSAQNKGEKIKSRVAFQGTIDRRKKCYEPKTPATSKPHFQSPDFNSPEKSKTQSKAEFFQSSSPTTTNCRGLKILKKNNYKIAAARNAIIEQPNHSKLYGKLLHMETSPRVGDHGFFSMSKDIIDAPSFFCDEPLGSPIRRMRRAMRFVDQNTCITQRVAIDIGTSTRIIIPCFEGVTTVMDLVETVKQRFSEHNISGLKLFGQVLPLDGFVAELVDSENVLIAISNMSAVDGVNPAGMWKTDHDNDINNNVDDKKNNYDTIIEKETCKYDNNKTNNLKKKEGSVKVDKIKPERIYCNDDISINSDVIMHKKHKNTLTSSEQKSMATIKPSNIAGKEEKMGITCKINKTEMGQKKIDDDNIIDKKRNRSNRDHPQHQILPQSPSASLLKLKPFTPDRNILGNRTGLPNGRPKPNLLVKNKHSSTSKIQSQVKKHDIISDKFTTESLIPKQRKPISKKETQKMDASPAIDTMRDEGTVNLGKDIKDPSMMNSLVRDRLLERIVSLASRGAITPSQQKYLNSLIGNGDEGVDKNASLKILVPKPPENNTKKQSSLVIRNLKYNNVYSSGGKDVVVQID